MVRTDHGHGFRAVLGADLLQARGDVPQGDVPVDRFRASVFPKERLGEPLRVVDEIPGEASLDAEELAVDAGRVTVIGAEYFVVLYTERGLAAVAAVVADGSGVLQLPGAGLVAIRAAGERADRADVDAHAALLAVELVVPVRNNFRMRPAESDAQRIDVHRFVADPHAAITENAARGVEVDQRRELFLRNVDFFHGEAALGSSVTEDHVLELAFAALVADRAVERVVDEQKLQGRLPGLCHLLGLGSDFHAFGDDGGAGRLQFWNFCDLHHAHPAGGLE